MMQNARVKPPVEGADTIYIRWLREVMKLENHRAYLCTPQLFLAIGLVICAAGCRTRILPLSPKESGNYQSLLEWSHENGMPGAILLVQTPRTNFLGAVGWADVRRKVLMRPTNAFRIGSITKMFTGLTIMQLEKEGLLKTEATLTNYLPPSITKHISNSDKITVRQLLQNRSGIYDFADNPWWMIHYGLLDHHGKWSPLRHLQYAYDKPARFAPGKSYDYSNSNFILLGLIIDSVSGHSDSVEIRKRLLDPIGLTHTYYEISEAARGNRAHGYEKLGGFCFDTYDWTAITGGSMGLVSTASDLAHFLRAVIHQPRGDHHAAFEDSGDDFGIIWQRADHNKTPLSIGSVFFEQDGTSVFFGHAGVVPGYLSFAWRDPKNDITIVWFGSSTHRSAAGGTFAQTLQKALFQLALSQTNN